MRSIRKTIAATDSSETSIALAAMILALSSIAILTREFFNPGGDGIGWTAGGSGYLFQISSMVFVSAVYAGSSLMLGRRVHDIKQATRHKTRLSAEQARQNFRAISRHAIFSISDPDGRFMDFNDRFTEAFGYERDELIGQHSSMLYPNGRANRDLADIRTAMIDGRVWEGPQILRKKSGELVMVNSSFTPVFDDSGNRTHNLCIRSDLTELDAATSNHFLTEVLGDLQDEVMVYDRENLGLLYANKAACQRYGWKPEKISKFKIWESSINFDMELFREHVRPLVSGEKGIVRIDLKHETGPIEATTRLFQTPDGKHAFLTVVRDREENQRLEAARMEWFSQISHELRTPLTSIRGALRLLETGAMGDLSKEASDVMQIASRNCERLITIVSDILDLQKIVAGKLDCECATLDLADFIKDAVKANRGYGDEFGIKLQTGDLAQDAFICGNETRLMQVMGNLLSNAIKNSPRGAPVLVELEDMGTSWRVSVSDKGAGIPEEARDRLFRNFSQLDPFDGKSKLGTGLGLVIARKIVQLHKGTVDFESEQGKGTKFFFDLPKQVIIAQADNCRGALAG